MKNVQSARMQLLKGEAKAAARPGTNALPSAATKEIASASSGTLPALMEVQISEATTESARITSMALANVSVKAEEKNILENITKKELVESVESFQNSVSNNVETKFIGELRGEKITLYDVKVENIYYVKRSSEELITLRNEFNTVTRKSFLKELGKNPEVLKLAGLSDSDILKIQNGRVPNGWQVHHKLPLDDSGTNTFDNLVLIQNEPYHKVITNYQNSMSVNMNVGDTKNLKWPIPNNNIYPTTK